MLYFFNAESIKKNPYWNVPNEGVSYVGLAPNNFSGNWKVIISTNFDHLEAQSCVWFARCPKGYLLAIGDFVYLDDTPKNHSYSTNKVYFVKNVIDNELVFSVPNPVARSKKSRIDALKQYFSWADSVGLLGSSFYGKILDTGGMIGPDPVIMADDSANALLASLQQEYSTLVKKPAKSEYPIKWHWVYKSGQKHKLTPPVDESQVKVEKPFVANLTSPKPSGHTIKVTYTPNGGYVITDDIV